MVDSKQIEQAVSDYKEILKDKNKWAELKCDHFGEVTVSWGRKRRDYYETKLETTRYMLDKDGQVSKIRYTYT